ncbi:hypothetical protein [Breoghania corrubedonensis]|uniref:hypothetical protein n=1 Tax=Breoghania corrubedonensis TaxID=665038 RepID=UPI0011B22521|nr:hypothetical protein [Breoghania corrubedonensis]
MSVEPDCGVSNHTLERCDPALPEGMRVDWCSLETVAIDCAPGDRIIIALSLQPAGADEWEVSREAGEYLDAIEFSSRQGTVACVAMRSPEWMEDQYGLRVVEANSERLDLRATYEATVPAKPVVQIAIAETGDPASESENLSPWYAVDLALKF